MQYVNRLLTKRLQKRVEMLDVAKVDRALKTWGLLFNPTFVDPFSLITRHNAECYKEARFVNACKFAHQKTGQKLSPSKSQILLWAAETASKLPGAFVELGVGRGYSAHSILHYLDKQQPNHFYLFDSFSGVDKDQLLPEEGHQASAYFNDYHSGYESQVRSSFAEMGNVTIVSGFVPQSLSLADPESVAFLHVDLNAALPEVAGLSHFWPKLTQGALVVLDDYSQVGREAQKNAIDELGRQLGYVVCSLPTGQGLIVAVKQSSGLARSRH